MFKDIFISGIILLILDFIFIGINKKAFENQVAGIQRTAMIVKPVSALICYIFLIFGLYYFIIRQKKSIMDAFLFGLVIYGVYETTSYTIFKKWSPTLATIDTIWGGVLMALTTWLTYSLMK
uniref:DUF2177 family protein n=1 Tax=viral metagenome TaxID=1070528 RepID=A0A6C0DK65_9ZZZZ